MGGVFPSGKFANRYICFASYPGDGSIPSKLFIMTSAVILPERGSHLSKRNLGFEAPTCTIKWRFPPVGEPLQANFSSHKKIRRPKKPISSSSPPLVLKEISGVPGDLLAQIGQMYIYRPSFHMKGAHDLVVKADPEGIVSPLVRFNIPVSGSYDPAKVRTSPGSH